MKPLTELSSQVIHYFYHGGVTMYSHLQKLLVVEHGFYGARTGEELIKGSILIDDGFPHVEEVHTFLSDKLQLIPSDYSLIDDELKVELDELIEFYSKRCPYLLREPLHHEIKTKEDIIPYYKKFLEEVNGIIDMVSNSSFIEVMRELKDN